MGRPIAVLCSDIHLSHRAPVFRSTEPDWYDAMARSLGQLSDIAGSYDVPIVCAGDVFDRWNPPPELINFAIDNLPEMYAIPGQHDLPNHSNEFIHRSAYWTLVKSGRLIHIGHDVKKVPNSDLALFGFPWNTSLYHPGEWADTSRFLLAVIHAYVWKKGYEYVGAEESFGVSRFVKQLSGYHAAVFGDNHKGFFHNSGGLSIMNCGGFMIRKSDEIGYRPRVGVLFDDKTIKPVYLDTSEDRYLEVMPNKELSAERRSEMGAFVEELSVLGADGSLDFRDSVNRYVDANVTDERIRRYVFESIGE